MLLNRGAYGDRQFFSEETFTQMTPRDLEPLMGVKRYRGIGLGPIGSRKDFWGAEGASGASVRICPQAGIMVAITRFSPGPNYYDWEARIEEAIMGPESKATATQAAPAGRK